MSKRQNKGHTSIVGLFDSSFTFLDSKSGFGLQNLSPKEIATRYAIPVMVRK
ncbi:hypothetical protein GJ744_011737 [Endocarpon pusillum]|uniref:Uncharacterized protein n=1 Tax=Endocarpon pusillum TaxID=364733 RepID=A0A8H7E206_9EURO|nr:hypothetical protein GJ744_011737 [Endocarpon pusillum]